MLKRFSGRELGLLMLPVLLVGALGLWVSKRPRVDDSRLRLKLQLQKPTMLQAFAGNDLVLIIAPVEPSDVKEFNYSQFSNWLELRTSQGAADSRRASRTVPWGRVLGGGVNNDTELIRTQALPPASFFFMSLAPLLLIR